MFDLLKKDNDRKTILVRSNCYWIKDIMHYSDIFQFIEINSMDTLGLYLGLSDAILIDEDIYYNARNLFPFRDKAIFLINNKTNSLNDGANISRITCSNSIDCIHFLEQVLLNRESCK